MSGGNQWCVPCVSSETARSLPRQRTWASYVNRACLANRKGNPPRRLRVRLLSASDDFIFTRDWVPRKGGASRWVHHN